jgi:hypothetical protein
LFFLLLAAPPPSGDYDALVALGVSEGRAGNVPQAEQAFERAIASSPGRPEAHVEYGGLHFLQGRYDRAIVELRQAVKIRDDHYTRGLLASSLHLAGRSEEALDQWNRIEEPALQAVEIVGLRRVRAELVRSELDLPTGELLTRDRMTATAMRLRELGVFSQVRLRPIPQGDGTGQVEVALVEKPVFGDLAETIVMTGAYAAQKKVRLRLTNLDGGGLTLTGSYRWQSTQPKLAFGLAWPRPVGLPFNLHVDAERGRPQYQLQDRFTLRTRGLDMRLRRVLGGKTVAEAGWLLSHRQVQPAEVTKLSALQLGLERNLLDAWRHRVDLTLRGWISRSDFGSDISTYRTLAQLKYQIFLSPPEDKGVERSVLVTQITFGHAGEDVPLDEMFVLGAGTDSAHPLRAHRQKKNGVLGQSPISRRLALVNVEWRRRLWQPGVFSLSTVVFYDGAWPSHSVRPEEDGSYHDAGIGLRLGRGGTVVRVDYGRSLTGDRKDALTAGLGQAF